MTEKNVQVHDLEILLTLPAKELKRQKDGALTKADWDEIVKEVLSMRLVLRKLLLVTWI